jgi:uncharacterized membrane protein YqiK
MNGFSGNVKPRNARRTLHLAASLLAPLAIAAALPQSGLARPSGGLEAAKLATSEVRIAQNVIPAPLAAPPTLQRQNAPFAIAEMGVLPLPWLIVPIILGGAVVGVIFSCGLVIVSEQEVGIIVKKFAAKGLSPGKIIALNGEAGYQADTLAPGWHWGFWPWQFEVRKEKAIVVPQGEIALVVAADGTSIPPERILAKVVDCDNFQDARKFLAKGGEKGRQIGYMTAGTYRINTALFTVITAANGAKNGISPDRLKVHTVLPDQVGIVTVLDGAPINPGEIAGPMVPGHENFQNAQTFISNSGRRGLQEQVLLSGSWNLNPWFTQVEQVPMTEIPIGYVGVVISYVGKAHEDVSGSAFTHGDLVKPGHKGVWTEPLYPGKHPLNSRVMKVELVPTTNIVLNWSNRSEGHRYDDKLSTLKVRSRDGFAFELQVAQIIHVGALDAPKVIFRVGSMQNLVDHVLEPTIGNYFRNSAQDYTVLDFLSARSERQTEAAEFIKLALRIYDVQAIDTLIGEIQPPAELMLTQTERKIAEEQRKTYEVQQMAQTQRQQLVRETALAEIQQEMVKSEQSVQISKLKADAHVQEATGEAEATKLKAGGEAEGIRAIGQAKAETYRAGVDAIGGQGFTAMQLMQIIGDRQVRLIPDVMVGGSNGNGNGLVDGLLSMLLWNQTGKDWHSADSKPPSKPVVGDGLAPRDRPDSENDGKNLPMIDPDLIARNLSNRNLPDRNLTDGSSPAN